LCDDPWPATGLPLKVITKYALILKPYLYDDPWTATGLPLKVITKSVLKSGRICVMTPGPPRVITQQKKILNSLESKLSDDFRIFFCW